MLRHLVAMRYLDLHFPPNPCQDLTLLWAVARCARPALPRADQTKVTCFVWLAPCHSPVLFVSSGDRRSGQIFVFRCSALQSEKKTCCKIPRGRKGRLLHLTPKAVEWWPKSLATTACYCRPCRPGNPSAAAFDIQVGHGDNAC